MGLEGGWSARPYATEYAFKHIMTTFINALMKEGLPIPRFLFAFEADEEVGGEVPTITSRPFCTRDGELKNVPCMVVSPHAYERKAEDAPALVMSEEFHAKVVKCFKRQVKEVRLVNFGTRGLNDGLILSLKWLPSTFTTRPPGPRR